MTLLLAMSCQPGFLSLWKRRKWVMITVLHPPYACPDERRNWGEGGDGSPTAEFLYAEDAAEGIHLATLAYNDP